MIGRFGEKHVLCAVLLAFLAGGPASPVEGQRLDRQGEPLPPDAIARLGTLRLWHGQPVTCLDFSPDGKLVATSSHPWPESTPGDWMAKPRRGACIWDAATGNQVLVVGSSLEEPLGPLRFSPDGKILAAGSKQAIYLWDLPSGILRRRLKGHKYQVQCLTFSSDSAVLWTGASPDGWSSDKEKPSELYCWDVARGTKQRLFVQQPMSVLKGKGAKGTSEENVVSMAFSPDGKLLVTSSEAWLHEGNSTSP